MTQISRRAALGALAAGLTGIVAGLPLAMILAGRRPPATRLLPPHEPLLPGIARSPRGRTRPPHRDNPVVTENKRPGSEAWRIGQPGIKAADDIGGQIQGYASATSVNVGDSIEFHVQAEEGFTISIYRLGYYGDHGGRRLRTSPILGGIRQPAPELDDATGLVSCNWAPVWRLDVPADWTSGVYLAVFTSQSGWRSVTPFVVRDDQRSADLCVILPFSTYQAYNRWPIDYRLGKSLYVGYEVSGPNAGRSSYARRAVKVSFDRPYHQDGMPLRFDSDHEFVRWAESQGYDVTYATTIDLHSGLVDPARYRGLIFCGHDEYWSATMRDITTTAVAQGTNLAFMMANNVYWHVRFERSPEGRDNRILVCYKSDPDPQADQSRPTGKWRDIDETSAEQGLLGVQYNGILPTPVPLVVQAADHWLWANCGVRDGDRIRNLVAGEADGLDSHAPRPQGVTQTLLSRSPYRVDSGETRVQNTSVYETTGGSIVFDAGTFNWVPALSRPGHLDRRIQTATANLLDRMVIRRA